MPFLHTLRQSHFIARLAVVWFVLSLGAAIAAPMLNPAGTVVVCNAAGGIKLVATEAGSTDTVPHTLDCPLCATTSTAPPSTVLTLESQQNLSYVLQSISAARIAALTAVVPPARGPPASH